LTSKDGITWTAQTSGTNVHLYGITYGDNKFVVAGGGTVKTLEGMQYLGGKAAILTSTDGISWSTQTLDATASRLTGIAYGNGMFLAVGPYETALMSMDGTAWLVKTFSDQTLSLNEPGVEPKITDMIYSDKTDNGINGFVPTDYAGFDLYASAYGDNKFVAVGDTLFTISTGSSTLTATPTSSTVLVNGTSVPFQAYNIGGSNYFKLRDTADVLNGTGKQFNVGWDGTNNAITITSNTAYTPVGGELTNSGGSSSISAALSTAKVYLDGKEVSLTAYTINGNNYFKLRDVAAALNFGVTYDSSTSTIAINATTGYSAG